MHKRCNILGVGVSTINLPQAIATIDDWIAQRQSQYICVTPVHSIMDCYHDPSLKPIFNRSGLTTPDGMPVVWLLRLYGHKQVDRVYGPDLMRTVCQRTADNHYRHFFYGGAEGVPEKLAETLGKLYPSLNIVGTYSPPFRALSQAEDQEIIDRINQVRPDIVWVGLGSPKQERWMAEHVHKIEGATLIGVGAAFDFLTNRKPQAPRWLQRSGFEWAFRLLCEPRRLAHRYLVNNPLFLWLLLLSSLHLRQFQLESTEQI